jgi:hypothetical protein
MPAFAERTMGVKGDASSARVVHKAYGVTKFREEFMKAQLMSVFGTVSVATAIGCGGATSADLPGPDGGTPISEGAAPAQEASSNPTPAADGGSSPISPSGLGAMLAGSVDGGVPSFGVTSQVATGCDALCANEATANCPNQGATSDCALGCRLLLNNSACAAATMSLLACEGTSTVSCDSTGKATLDNCGVQTLSSAACFLQNANDPTLAMPCATYCAKVAAAACPNDDPTGCQQGCQVIGGFVAACDPLWKAYVACADSDAGAVTCGTDGKAGASSCLVQALSYAACLYGGVSTTIDAGQ